MEQFQKYLKEALQNIKIADHLLYVTFPLINERRLLLKVFEEVYKAVVHAMYAIISYESLLGRVNMHEQLSENMKNFFKLARHYDIAHEQLTKIKEICDVHEQRRLSMMEFVKQEKIVIMSKSLKTNVLDSIKIKEYLLTAKQLVMHLTKKIN